MVNVQSGLLRDFTCPSAKVYAVAQGREAKR